MAKMLIVLIAFLIIPLILGIYLGVWELWRVIVPALWPSGPTQIIRPGFWLFSGAWLLLSLIFGGIFRRGGE